MSRAIRLASGTLLVAASFAASSAPAARHGAASAASTGAAAPASTPAVAAKAPVEFAGLLATDVTYVADMFFDARALHVWRPVRDVQPGRDVAWTIAWTNLDQFPALKTAATQAKPQRFRFRVVKTDLLSGSPKLPWMATYRCEILAVEPLPGAAPPAKRRR